MAEEKGEKKRLAILKRILKWIGLGIVTVLLIAGVIFQAPWKITGLLLILLLACTVLPKPARKWFWLSVGVIVIGLVTWVFLPEGDGDWRPYTFDEELAAFEAKRAIPDDENAATIYHQLLKEQDEEGLYPDFLDDELDNLIINEPWSSKDYPKLAEWLEAQQDILTILIETSKIEKCRFPLGGDPMIFDRNMDMNRMMRHWAYLLIRAGNNDIAESRVGEALKKYKTVLQMANHLHQQLTMSDVLVGMAIEALALKQFDRFIVIGTATEEHLKAIEEALVSIKHDWTSSWPMMLDCEKLFVKNQFGRFYEVNAKGKIRLSHDQYAEMREWLKLNVYPSYFQKKLMKAETIFSWFYIPSTPQKAAAIIDASYQKYYAMAEPDFDWEKKPKKFSIISPFSRRARFNYHYMIQLLAEMSEEPYHMMHDGYLRVASKQRGTKILIALRRYKNKTGQWPESLEDIKELTDAENFIDPINGGSFVYKLTDENFTFYSKGKNNIDEDGQYNVKVDRNTFERKVKEDDWPIWPDRYEIRKRREETIDAE